MATAPQSNGIDPFWQIDSSEEDPTRTEVTPPILEEDDPSSENVTEVGSGEINYVQLVIIICLIGIFYILLTILGLHIYRMNKLEKLRVQQSEN